MPAALRTFLQRLRQANMTRRGTERPAVAKVAGLFLCPHPDAAARRLPACCSGSALAGMQLLLAAARWLMAGVASLPTLNLWLMRENGLHPAVCQGCWHTAVVIAAWMGMPLPAAFTAVRFLGPDCSFAAGGCLPLLLTPARLHCIRSAEYRLRWHWPGR